MVSREYIIKQINLDKIFKYGTKHVDKALLLRNNILVLIEETGRPEIRDLEKIENTISSENLDLVKSVLSTNLRAVYVFIHFSKGDTFLIK